MATSLPLGGLSLHKWPHLVVRNAFLNLSDSPRPATEHHKGRRQWKTLSGYSSKSTISNRSILKNWLGKHPDSRLLKGRLRDWGGYSFLSSIMAFTWAGACGSCCRRCAAAWKMAKATIEVFAEFVFYMYFTMFVTVAPWNGKSSKTFFTFATLCSSSWSQVESVSIVSKCTYHNIKPVPLDPWEPRPAIVANLDFNSFRKSTFRNQPDPRNHAPSVLEAFQRLQNVL